MYIGHRQAPSSAALDLPLDFGLGAATYETVTGARGHIDPGIAPTIFLRAPGARRVRRLAVVLACLGAPRALICLELVLRGRPRLGYRGQGQSGGEGGGYEETGLFHRVSPCLYRVRTCTAIPCLHPQCYEHGSVQSATHPHSVFYPLRRCCPAKDSDW